MPGYPECRWCEFRDDPDRTCSSYATGNRRRCEILEHAEAVRGQIRAETLADPRPGYKAPDAPPPPPQAAPDPVPLSVTLERIELMRGCDYRGPVAQCGCTPLRVCWLGKGSRPDADAGYGHVTERECMSCPRVSSETAGDAPPA